MNNVQLLQDVSNLSTSYVGRRPRDLRFPSQRLSSCSGIRFRWCFRPCLRRHDWSSWSTFSWKMPFDVHLLCLFWLHCCWPMSSKFVSWFHALRHFGFSFCTLSRSGSWLIGRTWPESCRLDRTVSWPPEPPWCCQWISFWWAVRHFQAQKCLVTKLRKTWSTDVFVQYWERRLDLTALCLEWLKTFCIVITQHLPVTYMYELFSSGFSYGERILQ